MQKLIVIAILVSVGWYGYGKYQARALSIQEAAEPPQPVTVESNAAFRCDGRTHCSQMTSCAEATYFLKNCPGTKMDGNNDGIPCERQWCK